MTRGRQLSQTNHDEAADSIDAIANKVCEKFASVMEAKIDKKLNSLECSINEKFSELQSTMSSLKKTVSSNSHTIDKLETQTERQIQYNQRSSLRFLGLEATNGTEDIVRTVLNFLQQDLKIKCDQRDLDSAYRVGRAIRVQFISNLMCNQVFNARKLMRNSKVSIFEDLTKKNYDLLKKAKEIYGIKGAWSLGGKVFIRSKDDNTKKLVLSENDL
ncbi:unnamed protein product [Phaedon cochleariae]|uniref:Zinc finger DNA binding protein n=1 Tax=Phaedon cochleariae TaxID=80249 RepID=A0A9P0DUH5_PHACE|nr:unnamed protein product [Phaedon cochleariae]